LARELREKLTRVEAENPGVVPPEDALRRQLEYVATHAATIQAILPKLDQLVAPVAGSGVRMMKQEISQGFYSTVMGVNPSASMRENLPVESVAYADAQAFCAALGWMCGRSVRLPTVAEYKAAMGDLALPPAAKNAWTFDNTDGVSARPVGSSQPTGAGYFDLLGNVEEWAQAEATDDFASVVGGSVNWVPVSGLPLRKALKREKSRTIGFRIVIE
jgi:formylglycine-generating enzyme required for sulfatase activity